MAKDYYELLGVGRNASDDELRKAYRKLAHEHHPDKPGGNEAKFKEINEAYQVLKDPKRRAQYDQFGPAFEQARSQGGFNFEGFSDFADAFSRQGGGQNFSFDLNDILGDMFGMGGRGRSRQQRGSDIEVELTIPFREAVFGTEQSIKLEKTLACAVCQGSGAEPGSSMNTCSTCKGTGQIVRSIGFGIGMPSVCTDCHGAGKKPEKICKHCKGKGTERGEKSLRVKIPAGIDDGQSIRVSGEGQAAGAGSQPGDLYIRVQVIPDPAFRRHGVDIHTTSEISFAQAALGDKVEVQTLDGPVTLKIPEATQSGKQFRLRGHGVPHLQGRGRGDQIVEVIVKTPTQLSRRQRKLLEDFSNDKE